MYYLLLALAILCLFAVAVVVLTKKPTEQHAEKAAFLYKKSIE